MPETPKIEIGEDPAKSALPVQKSFKNTFKKKLLWKGNRWGLDNIAAENNTDILNHYNLLYVGSGR